MYLLYILPKMFLGCFNKTRSLHSKDTLTEIILQWVCHLKQKFPTKLIKK